MDGRRLEPIPVSGHRETESSGDLPFRRRAAELVLEISDGALDSSRGFATRPPDRVQRTYGVEDGAADPQDRIGLERRRGFRLVGVDRSQQAAKSVKKIRHKRPTAACESPWKSTS